MAIVLRELAVKLGLQIDQKSFDQSKITTGQVLEGLKGVAGYAAEAAQKLLGFAEDVAEMSSRLSNTSQKLGITTDALQELGYVATSSGLKVADMDQALGALEKKLASAHAGGEGAKLFKQLGISIYDAAGKARKADDVFGEVSDKIAELPDGADKAALAVKVFGSGLFASLGTKLIPLLNKGSKGIADLRQEARDLGTVLSSDKIALGARLGDASDAIAKMWQGVRNELGAALLPELVKSREATVAWVKANKEMIALNLARVLRGIGAAVKFVFDTIAVLKRNADVLVVAVGVMAAGFLYFKWAAVQSAVAAAAAWAAAAGPLLILAAALAGIVYLIDDFRMYLKLGKEADTLTGKFLSNFEDWAKPRDSDWWLVSAVKSLVMLLGQALQLVEQIVGVEETATQHAEKLAKRQKQGDDDFHVSQALARSAAGDALSQEQIDAVTRVGKTNPAVAFAAGVGPFLQGGTQQLAGSVADVVSSPGGVREIKQNNTNTLQVSINGSGLSAQELIDKVVPVLNDHWEAKWNGKMEPAAAPWED